MVIVWYNQEESNDCFLLIVYHDIKREVQRDEERERWGERGGEGEK